MSCEMSDTPLHASRRVRRSPTSRSDYRVRWARTVCYIAAKVLAHHDVPGRPVSSVKLLLDLSSNVLLDVVLLECGGCDVDALLLHFLAHVDIFNDGLGTGPILGGDVGGLGGEGVYFGF